MGAAGSWAAGGAAGLPRVRGASSVASDSGPFRGPRVSVFRSAWCGARFWSSSATSSRQPLEQPSVVDGSAQISLLVRRGAQSGRLLARAGWVRSAIRLAITAATAALISPKPTASSKPPGAAVTRTIFPVTERGPCGKQDVALDLGPDRAGLRRHQRDAAGAQIQPAPVEASLSVDSRQADRFVVRDPGRVSPGLGHAAPFPSNCVTCRAREKTDERPRCILGGCSATPTDESA